MNETTAGGWLESPRALCLSSRISSLDRLKLSHADMNYFLSLNCSSEFPFNIIERQLIPSIEIEEVIESVFDSGRELRSRMNPEVLKTNNDLVKFAKHVYNAVKDDFISASSEFQLLSPDIVLDIEASQTATFLIVMKSDFVNDSNTTTSTTTSSSSSSSSSSSLNDKNEQRLFFQLLLDLESKIVHTVSIKNNIIRSEMSIPQKNINFGRAVIGSTVSKSVTIVNKSIIPCLFSISKSGSISSGFLTIPSGRRGWIAAKSSLNIDFLFKPTLPGTFEEILKIENVLDPTNTQSIVIKARVTKPDTFQLFAQPNDDLYLTAKKSSLYDVGQELAASLDGVVQTNINTISSTSSNNNSSSSASITSHVTNVLLTSVKGSTYDDLSPSPASSSSHSSSLKTFFIGDLNLGEASDFTISFRIKNVTSKVRQFVVDAAHFDALTLVPPTKTFTANDDSNNNFIDDETNISSSWVWYMKTTDSYLFPTPIHVPFETDSDVLNSIIGMHCRFEMYPVNDESSGDITNLPAEERKRVEDKLGM